MHEQRLTGRDGAHDPDVDPVATLLSSTQTASSRGGSTSRTRILLAASPQVMHPAS